MEKIRIGLFFGSFNPIHIGHLIIANVMATHADLKKVWLVVSPHNPLKASNTLLHEFDRYDMAKAAVADHYKIEVSDAEFHLPKPSYTCYTLAHLREKFPACQFAVIMGEDNLDTFVNWKNYRQILEQYELYVYPRPRSSNSTLKNHPHVKMIDAPLLDISATYIRQCVREKKSIRYVVPEAVEKMIEMRGLFN